MSKVFNSASLLLLGFEGYEPTGQFKKLISENPPAGFVLLGNNFQDLEQLPILVSGIKSIVGDKVIFAVDQEPGRVQRFKGKFPSSKKPSYYIKQGGHAEFREWCKSTAELMKSVGLNMNLAPVLDLYSLKGDFKVLSDRVFGDDPAKVSDFALVLIEEFKKQQISVCAKHFPGLGCGMGDPHEVLTFSGESLERFLDYHWKPFKSVVKSGVDCIMTTHLKAPAIDPENCATFSKNAVSHLRNTVGHRGLIISDDLYMGGATNSRSMGNAAIDSFCAGHNLLIISKDENGQRQAIEDLKRRYDEDPEFQKTVIENEKKLDAFKQNL